ncbi:tyrosine-type recombinase/integrase [Kineosporiaceae bacterium B12]|nr:tyrosine-type recombinase/integrase [Kineococcus rubinsiae]
MTDLVVQASPITTAAPPARPAPLDRLPGSSSDDPFHRIAAAWLLSYGGNTQIAYRRDLAAWATWCEHRGVHPLAAERFHVDAWVRHLTTEPQARTGRPASAATIARRLSALSRFYDYGLHDAEVLTHSPVASVRRPKVSDESQAVGLTSDELRRLLAAAGTHSPRSAALVSLLTFCGLRISEALGADVRDYGHDQGHRVLKIICKGGKAARVPLPPPAVRVLYDYLGDRTSGRSSSPATPPAATRTRARMSSWGGSAGLLACPLGSRLTACATPTRPRACASAHPCRMSKTPWATPTHARRGATTAAATTSTAPPTTFSPLPSPAPTASQHRRGGAPATVSETACRTLKPASPVASHNRSAVGRGMPLWRTSKGRRGHQRPDPSTVDRCPEPLSRAPDDPSLMSTSGRSKAIRRGVQWSRLLRWSTASPAKAASPRVLPLRHDDRPNSQPRQQTHQRRAHQ